MSDDIFNRLERHADEEVLKIAARAERDSRNHPLWGELGIRPEDLSAGLGRWLGRLRMPQQSLEALKKKISAEIDEKTRGNRMVRASSIAGLKFINHLRV